MNGLARIKRETVQSNFREVVPLIHDHFANKSPTFLQAVPRRYYPVGRGLMIPFDPPMIYGVGGQLHFPWSIFWKSNPLKGEALSLFVTLVEEVLLQDPDLADARFEILDFSVPKGSRERTLVVTDARDIPRVSEARKREMLTIYAEGFRRAEEVLRNGPTPPRPEGGAPPDPKQPDLFG